MFFLNQAQWFFTMQVIQVNDWLCQVNNWLCQSNKKRSETNLQSFCSGCCTSTFWKTVVVLKKLQTKISGTCKSSNGIYMWFLKYSPNKSCYINNIDMQLDLNPVFAKGLDYYWFCSLPCHFPFCFHKACTIEQKRLFLPQLYFSECKFWFECLVSSHVFNLSFWIKILQWEWTSPNFYSEAELLKWI